MTPETATQQLRNFETIARFAGLQPNAHVVHIQAEPILTILKAMCEECTNQVSVKELKKNGGVCDNCADYGETK